MQYEEPPGTKPGAASVSELLRKSSVGAASAPASDDISTEPKLSMPPGMPPFLPPRRMLVDLEGSTPEQKSLLGEVKDKKINVSDEGDDGMDLEGAEGDGGDESNDSDGTASCASTVLLRPRHQTTKTDTDPSPARASYDPFSKIRRREQSCSPSSKRSRSGN